MVVEDLINEVAYFCFKYGIFHSSVKLIHIKAAIEKQLDEVEFVENLINIIFVKAKQRKKLSDPKTVELIIELEKLRLKMEQEETK